MSNSTKDYYQAKLLRLARVRTIAVILMFALTAALFYYVYDMRMQVTGVLTGAQETFQTLHTLSTQLEKADLPEILENANTLVQDGQDVAATATDGLNQAVEKLNELDMQALNKAIADLSNVVEPLAGLFLR